MSYTERPAFLQALHFDKILADCVKMHPCLYDTKTRGYRDKTDVDNAWDTIASNLKVENGKKKGVTNLVPRTASFLLVEHAYTTVKGKRSKKPPRMD